MEHVLGEMAVGLGLSSTLILIAELESDAADDDVMVLTLSSRVSLVSWGL